jgi:asparagine synthase (glutamine-hydrolysing)
MAFNTFCVSSLSINHGTKVVLSGLGGDELFGGYTFSQKKSQTGAMGQTTLQYFQTEVLYWHGLEHCLYSPFS